MKWAQAICNSILVSELVPTVSSDGTIRVDVDGDEIVGGNQEPHCYSPMQSLTNYQGFTWRGVGLSRLAMH